MTEHLYLIAFIPPEPLRDKIYSFKTHFRDTYHSAAAMRSPAHITLVPPFKRLEEDEFKIYDVLKALAAASTPFDLLLNGFDFFDKNKVVFIKPEIHPAMIQIQQELKTLLLLRLHFSQKKLNFVFHPHITIGYRDLKQPEFEMARREFEKKHFEAVFCVKSVFLLKHNGKFWDIYREFIFRKTNI